MRLIAASLSIPIMLVLALQWPLREWLGRDSRDVNDFGPYFFALYVAAAITAAARAGGAFGCAFGGALEPPPTLQVKQACRGATLKALGAT